MVVGDDIVDASFRGLAGFLRPGDLLVLNETRVIPARLHGTRSSGGAVEVLLLHPVGSERYHEHALHWEVLVRPGRRVRPGETIRFGNDGTARVQRDLGEGRREIALHVAGDLSSFLQRAGRLPLPPYIRNDSDEAQQRYQTIFAREPGSVAAPTASLHFTQAVFDRLSERGIERVPLVLDVGIGTFRPMQSARIDEHVMHAETYQIPTETAEAIVRARSQGRRIVAAGTTVVRALEGNAAQFGKVRAGAFSTDIFITPGFDFRVVDAMITNFHLPNSTLLVLVSAFAGRDRILSAYRHAIAAQYRFFSFGDAMLLERTTS